MTMMMLMKTTMANQRIKDDDQRQEVNGDNNYDDESNSKNSMVVSTIVKATTNYNSNEMATTTIHLCYYLAPRPHTNQQPCHHCARREGTEHRFIIFFAEAAVVKSLTMAINQSSGFGGCTGKNKNIILNCRSCWATADCNGGLQRWHTEGGIAK